MEFLDFRKLIGAKITEIFQLDTQLYIVDVDQDRLWETYLNSFPEGTNELYRERRFFDCSCCRSFVKRFGGVIAIGDDMKPISIWDVNPADDTYAMMVQVMSRLVKRAKIRDVFVTKDKQIGQAESHENRGDHVHTWHHLYTNIPRKHINRSPAEQQSEMRSAKEVFHRSLSEITRSAVNTILDLISQNSLYKGNEWQVVLEKFLQCKDQYIDCKKTDVDRFCWSKSFEVGPVIARIRNHSIGVLLIDVSEGMPLDVAVKKYEKIVAPTNYKRPKPIFTKKMVDEAQKTVEELGLVDSLPRRYAVIEDISVGNILFANKGAVKKMSGDVFDEIKDEASGGKISSFDRVEEISIDDFIANVVPRISEMEVLFEYDHIPNLVSLIAPQNADSPTLFKWGNAYSWSYNGNIADSMKEQVKAAGGKIHGVLRFSIRWNENGDNQNDFDAHSTEPSGNEIYYVNKGQRHPSSGMLDVDIIHPKEKQVAVENIIYDNLAKMPPGKYLFRVHNYNERGGVSGFRAEIEFSGEVYRYNYAKPIARSQYIDVAEVTLSADRKMSIKHKLSESCFKTQEWGIKTGEFHQVSVCMLSPNYWDQQTGIGHKHYFFMLDKCVNDGRPNGFYNEFLKQDLAKHKRVFELLGSKMKVEISPHQLSGIGFSSTKRSVITCRVKGSVNRVIKVKI